MTTSVGITPFGFNPLSTEDLRRFAPSVFTEHARPGVSSRYTFVSTSQVVALLQSEGWEPVKACQQRVRVATRAGFQTHEIRFARRDDLKAAERAGEVRPEMILQNAHDGTSAYRIDAGLYRLACRNGLVVADADFAHVTMRHVDLSPERFAAAARDVSETTPRVLESVARWQSIQLTPAAREEFASRALGLRWNADQPVTRLLNPSQLLTPRRYGDHATDLWVTLNAVQENLLRGGASYQGLVPSGMSTRFVRNTTRALGAIKEAQRVNKALWSLAEEFSRS